MNNMVIANFFVTILVRQQYVINFLFWLATRAPVHWPLSVRWHLGKVYHHGGLHSGTAVNGTLWFALYTGALFFQLTQGKLDVSSVTLGASLAPSPCSV